MLRTVHRPCSTVPTRKRGVIPALAPLVLVLGVIATTLDAAAQTITSFEPRYFVIQEETVPLKAAPGSVHYAVAMLKRGQVVRADGQTSEDPVFLQIEYPVGVPVFVKAEEAEALSGKSQVRLTVDSRLRAANLSGGERGHWWSLLPEDAPLPAGTTLKVMKELQTPENRVYGYHLVAPPQARGFISAKAVRDASAAEVEDHLRQLAGMAGPAEEPAAPAGGNAPVEQPAQPQPVPATDQATPAPVTATPPADPPSVPAAEPQPEPAPTQPEPAVEAPAETAPEVPKVASMETLASLFDQAQAQPIREAELSEVIAEFNRATEALGNSPEEQQTKDYIKARLELLKLRAELQKSIRAAEALAGNAAQTDDRYTNQLTTLERSRSYTVVGRLMPSTVYDGRRLPKMYRVQSVDEGFSRTVAYLMPQAGDTDLESKIGRVVGIIGQTQIDPALRVNIVRPRRVEVLTPAAPPAPVPEAAAPAPAPSTAG